MPARGRPGLGSEAVASAGTDDIRARVLRVVSRVSAFPADALKNEQKLLDEMTEIAEAARGIPDARVRKLIDWIREHMCPDLPKAGKRTAAAAWNDTRILIFTEYDDTKRYLVQQLSAVIDGTDRADNRIQSRAPS